MELGPFTMLSDGYSPIQLLEHEINRWCIPACIWQRRRQRNEPHCRLRRLYSNCPSCPIERMTTDTPLEKTNSSTLDTTGLE